MNCLEAASAIFLAVSVAGLLSVFVVYPAMLALLSLRPWRHTPPSVTETAPLPAVSILVAVRNGAEMIERKIENGLSLDYPAGLLQFVYVSDGSTDSTEDVLRRRAGPNTTVLALPCHSGKIEALNRGLCACSGEVVVFSDADALLDRGSLRSLVRPFGDPRVGGVCGQRVIHKDPGEWRDAQQKYVGWDSAVKRGESRLGFLSSNDGKLYAVRRSLVPLIPSAVTDDLYVCLAVRRQGHRFVFAPEARAFIRLPSRSPAHEFERRRRIVSQSLHGLSLMRELLNPFRYGAFAVGLLINKVLRRCTPVFMVLLALGSVGLAPRHGWAAALLAVQASAQK